MATIPANHVLNTGVQYFAVVNTAVGLFTHPPIDASATPFSISVEVNDMCEGSTYPASAYRMFSIPLAFSEQWDGTIENLLSDQGEFGPYEPVQWRVFRYIPDYEQYAELSDAGADTLFRPGPGKAYWLICKSANTISTAPIAGYSTPVGDYYNIELEPGPGWHQVGNPFAFRIAWDSVLVVTSGGDTLSAAEAESSYIEPPVRWDVDSGYQYDVTVLEPFCGYWIKNISNEALVLRVPPRDVQAWGMPGVLRRASRPTNGDAWKIEITASSCGVIDGGNTLGIHEFASIRRDRHDRSEPPMNPGRAVSLYFPHRDWAEGGGNYTVDMRGDDVRAVGASLGGSGDGGPIGGGDTWGHVWRFDVAKNFAAEGVGDKVILDFSYLESVPADASIYLIDGDLCRQVDLRDEHEYVFYLGERKLMEREEDARFAVLVGSPEFVEGYDGLPGLPSRTVLHKSRPNPFKSSTIIRYELARSGWLSLKIYDVNGALVRVLYDGVREPGRYEMDWDGRNDRHEAVSSGLYFCRLKTSGDKTHAIKMLAIK
jgi:hypothetical protein